MMPVHLGLVRHVLDEMVIKKQANTYDIRVMCHQGEKRLAIQRTNRVLIETNNEAKMKDACDDEKIQM